ncbi:LytTR family transcriptional regulator DNA-binding domain-containing protein [Emticicia sp. SJ17W-69]|uniref:LytTR family transcriptional regulator DNA-binding domain-containing protein n=1 Tax=Emticicia sp. SJ17W-69 TaxID=3421657 RepID=UPI003EBF3B0E
MNSSNNLPNTLVHVGGRKHVQPEEVIILIADSNYTTIFLASGKNFMVATNIGKIQKILQAHGQFIRTNKAQVVNWAYVISSTYNQLLLHDNKIVIFSRRRRIKVRPQLISNIHK